MIETVGASTLAAIAGLFGGILLGLSARLGRFCTLGAIEDLYYGGSDQRMRMWAIAIGVAIFGVYFLVAIGALDPIETPYLSQSFNPLAAVLGGALFGYGMALAGSCGYGALARLGGGDLRYFVVVLVLGVSSYVTLSGPLAYVRVWAFPATEAGSAQGIAHLVSDLSGLSVASVGLVIGGAILVAALSGKSIRSEPKVILWGVLVGVAVVSGFWATYWIATESFGEIGVESHTFSAPPGETILWLMTASGSSLSLGIGSVAGVLLGSFAGSLVKGHFRWEACEDPRELKRQILGAILMGIGAVTALGCTIGQGVSAFAVLAYSAPLTLTAIVGGAALGLKQLITGFAPEI